MARLLVIYSILIYIACGRGNVEETEDIQESHFKARFQMDNLKSLDNTSIAMNRNELSSTEKQLSNDFEIIKNKLGIIEHALKTVKGKLMSTEKAVDNVRGKVTEFELVVPEVVRIRNKTDQIELGIEHITDNLTTLDIHIKKVSIDTNKEIERKSENLENKINILINNINNSNTGVKDVNDANIVNKNIELLERKINNVSSIIINMEKSLGTAILGINLVKTDISHMNERFDSAETDFDELNISFETDRNTLTKIKGTIDVIHNMISDEQQNANSCTGEFLILNNRFNSLESKILSMEKTVTEASGKISSLETIVKTSESKDSIIQDMVISLENNIINAIINNFNTLQSDLGGVKLSVDSTKQVFEPIRIARKATLIYIDILKTSVTLNIDKTSIIQGSVNDIKTDFGDVKRNIYSVFSKISSIEDAVNSDSIKISQMQATVDDIKDNVEKISIPKQEGLMTSGGSGVSGDCKYPFIKILYQCVYLEKTYMKYDSAWSYCLSIGGNRLMEVKNRETLSELREYLKTKHLDRSESILIGATDKKNEGQFVWSSGSYVSLSWGWGEDEPDNFNNEDCLAISMYKDALFNDKFCNNYYFSLCEKL